MKEESINPLFIENDAVVFGIIISMLAVIFYTANLKSAFWQKFYKYVPIVLLCYFIPSLLNSFGLVDPEESNIYFVSSRYLLPASLVLLTMSIDLKEVFKLGPKALIMFFTATIGVVIGGPLAILIVAEFNADIVAGDVWKGMTTIAGSWIGGGANQAAMYDIFMVEKGATEAQREEMDALYSVMITIDVLVAEAWMFVLLMGVGRYQTIDKIFKADNSAIEVLKNKIESFSLRMARIPSATDLMVILGIVFGTTGLAHLLADFLGPFVENNYPGLVKFSLGSKFFWLIVVATTIGVALSFTKVKNYEGAGASKIGTVFIYILVASIGMKMDVTAIVEHKELFAVGAIWMAIHVVLLLVVGALIKAPFFFLAVGSKANIGGAASAPVIAAAFNPSLAPVGVLLAVLGYALGTYCAWICGLLMRMVVTTL